MVEKVVRLMDKRDHIRNIGVCAHIDHGKTTFSDNLLAGAGMISEELAGKQLALDFREDEQARGITIDAANVSMVHTFDTEEYLINLIDTPGHVDFGGDVTRAMRAVDGAIVLCDAVEGIMPQTETVMRQALKELVKPVLFINKVDRLIKELQLTPEQMQDRFVNIINNVNLLIRKIAPEEYKEKWQVNVQEGSVSFGSAFHNWALNFPYMRKHNLTFKTVIEHYQAETQKELAKIAPLHIVVLNMVIKHHPNPMEAQKYRIPRIWHGDVASAIGRGLLACDPNAPVAFICTKIVIDKHAGEVAAGRLFSGTIRQGQNVYMNGMKQTVRVQQVSVYNGAKREMVDKAPSGNIVGIVGLRNVYSGETISEELIEPFEAIKHLFEPVVTKAIEAKRPSDLPKLIEVLRQVNKEDPTIEVDINEETGEHLMHGMGELHLEVIENRIINDKGVEVQTGAPIVVYRETVTKATPGVVEGKSPNKHNKFYFMVEPLDPKIAAAIKTNELPEMRIKKKDMVLRDKLVALGMDSKTALRVKDFYRGNMFLDMTRGEVHIGEIMEMVLDMFEDVMRAGPLAREPCVNLLVKFDDVKLHEDAIHRGPAQVYPAVRDGIRGAIRESGPVMFEPYQTLQFEAPMVYMGEISKLISNKRGQLLDMTQEMDHVTIIAKMPVAEMFGMTSDLRSATEGRGHHFLVDQTFERLPYELQERIIKQIRERKGLSDAQ
ncbi:elongation factor EF-2 [Candidatus Woesearchaeota archaeon]|nr:elongation factor EF-2 [Candidatus Woesearchaeota archaeon]